MVDADSAEPPSRRGRSWARLAYILAFQRQLLDFTRAAGRKFAPTNLLMFPPTSRFLSLISLVAVIFFFASCAEDNRYAATQYLGGVYGGAPTYGAPQDTVSYWDGDNLGGKPTVKISLGEQRAYFYKSGLLVGISQLSTGREGLNTPVGHFAIIQKDLNHVSTKYGDYVDDAGNVVKENVELGKDPKPPGTHFKGAPMPYFMRIVDGVGMHAGYLPGYPASHGCIRMPEFMAQNFFKSVSTGTPVTITN
jgi:lipoprotein-anchoring transpeptidase ErfK/SrfK